MFNDEYRFMNKRCHARALMNTGVLRRTVSVSARNGNDLNRYRISGRDRRFEIALLLEQEPAPTVRALAAP
jgi:hypothetical protein